MFKSTVKAVSSVVFMLLINQQSVFASSSQGERFYVGAGISSTDLSINKANSMAKFPDYDDIFVGENAISLELLLGYQLDDFLSMELGFVDLGTLTARTGPVTKKLLTLSTFFIDATLATKVSEKVSVFAKAGISMWSATVDGSYDSVEEGNGVVYGAGIDLNLYGGDERQLRFEWKHHDFDELFLDQADSISMTLMMYF